PGVPGPPGLPGGVVSPPPPRPGGTVSVGPLYWPPWAQAPPLPRARTVAATPAAMSPFRIRPCLPNRDLDTSSWSPSTLDEASSAGDDIAPRVPGERTGHEKLCEHSAEAVRPRGKSPRRAVRDSAQQGDERFGFAPAQEIRYRTGTGRRLLVVVLVLGDGCRERRGRNTQFRPLHDDGIRGTRLEDADLFHVEGFEIDGELELDVDQLAAALDRIEEQCPFEKASIDKVNRDPFCVATSDQLLENRRSSLPPSRSVLALLGNESQRILLFQNLLEVGLPERLTTAGSTVNRLARCHSRCLRTRPRAPNAVIDTSERLPRGI